MSASKELVPIKFHGDTIYLIDKDNQPFTPVRYITENLGLDWKSQHRKITSHEKRWSVVMMTTQGREMVCMPVRKLPAFLLSIDTRKVKPEIRPKLELYQEECDQVLWDYWTKGFAGGAALPAVDDRYVRLLEKYAKLLEEKLRPKKQRAANRPLTNEELAKVYALEAEGLTKAEIARRLSRSSSTVSFIFKFRPKKIEDIKEARHA